MWRRFENGAKSRGAVPDLVTAESDYSVIQDEKAATTQGSRCGYRSDQVVGAVNGSGGGIVGAGGS